MANNINIRINDQNIERVNNIRIWNFQILIGLYTDMQTVPPNAPATSRSQLHQDSQHLSMNNIYGLLTSTLSQFFEPHLNLTNLPAPPPNCSGAPTPLFNFPLKKNRKETPLKHLWVSISYLSSRRSPNIRSPHPTPLNSRSWSFGSAVLLITVVSKSFRLFRSIERACRCDLVFSNQVRRFANGTHITRVIAQ